jgi:hypothetical protein
MTTSGFQNQLSPQDSQRFQDLYRSGNYSGAYGMVSGFAPQAVFVNPWAPNQSTYGAQNNIFNQYLAYFGLTDSGVTGHISNPPGQQSGQQPGQQPPVSFPQTPPSVLPSQQQQPGLPAGQGLPAGLIDFDPQLAYETFLRQNFNGPANDRRFLQGRFNDVYGQYAGQLGDQFTNTGQFPETSFYTEWLPQNLNPQDYLRQFNPNDRGQGTQQFNPQAQFNFRR